MTRDLIVGLLFLAAILLAGMVTVMVSGIPGNNANFPLEVQFDDVAGLIEGDPVRIRGFKQGMVKDIQYGEDAVVVSLVLFTVIPPLSGYSFEVLPSSPLGGTYVRYIPGRDEPLAKDVTLVGKAGGDVFAAMSDLISENREDIQKSVSSLRKLLESIEGGGGVVSDLFTNSDLKDDLTTSLANLKDITDAIREKRGVLGLIINDEETRENLASSISGLKATMDRLQATDSTVGALLNDPVMAENLAEIVARADRISASIERGDGLIGQLLLNKELVQYFTDFSSRAADIMERIQTGRGIISQFINDDELGDVVHTAITDVGEIIGRVRSGPGTAYSLVYEQELYATVMEAVTLIRDTTEDAREQAPISTFFGILFAPF